MIPTMNIRSLINFILATRADVVHIDGAREMGKDIVLDQLRRDCPNSVVYEATHACGEIDELTGAILGGNQGLGIGQARLGALDFLEQVPVDQVVLFDRSPLSSLVFEPTNPSSFAEVHGWIHRITHGRLRQILILVENEHAPELRLAEQQRYETLVAEYLLAQGVSLRMHVFTARIGIQDRKQTLGITASHLTTAWDYNCNLL